MYDYLPDENRFLTYFTLFFRKISIVNPPCIFHNSTIHQILDYSTYFDSVTLICFRESVELDLWAGTTS